MAFFTSNREKKLWIAVLAIIATIYSTLFIGRPLAKLFASQNTQAIVFLMGMLLVGLAVLMYAFKFRPNKIELSLLFGMIAVYAMFIMRLGLAERSHLIEYSILTIAIHTALLERSRGGKTIARPTLASFLLTFFIGLTDECLQLLIPTRVFDPIDILFNSLAAAFTIGMYLLFSWAQKLLKKPKN